VRAAAVTPLDTYLRAGVAVGDYTPILPYTPGSAFAGIINWASETKPVRMLNDAVFGIDQRRTLPSLSRRTFEAQVKDRRQSDPNVLLFNDTFTNSYDPEMRNLV